MAMRCRLENHRENDKKRLLVCFTALLLTACGTTQINLADTCEGKPARSQCWMELQSHNGCYVWNAFLLDGMTASWEGSCSNQLAGGTGTLTFFWEDKARVGTGSLVGGKSDGLWVLHHADGRVEEVTYANGKMSDR